MDVNAEIIMYMTETYYWYLLVLHKKTTQTLCSMISRAGNTLGQDKYVKYVFLLLVCLIGCLSFVWIESYYSCKMVIIYTVCPIFHMSNYPILHCTFHFQLSTHKFPLYIPLIYTIYIYIYTLHIPWFFQFWIRKSPIFLSLFHTFTDKSPGKSTRRCCNASCWRALMWTPGASRRRPWSYLSLGFDGNFLRMSWRLIGILRELCWGFVGLRYGILEDFRGIYRDLCRDLSSKMWFNNDHVVKPLRFFKQDLIQHIRTSGSWCGFLATRNIHKPPPQHQKWVGGSQPSMECRQGDGWIPRKWVEHHNITIGFLLFLNQTHMSVFFQWFWYLLKYIIIIINH